MKKFYSVFAASLLAASAFAQTNMNLKKEINPVKRSFSNLNNKELRKADPTSNWYIPADFIADQATYQSSINVLMGDTSAKWINTDGTIRYGNAVDGAMAQVIDPKDDNIDLMSTSQVPKLSKFTNFTIDSVAFDYAYVRRVDSVDNTPVVDTVFVYYFKGTQISTSQSLVKAGETKTTKFGMLGWNFTTRTPDNYIGIDTILLDKSFATKLPDANGWAGASMRWKVKTPVSVNTANGSSRNSLIAYAIKFKSGMSYDTSYVMEDRRDATQIPADTKWVNYFSGTVVANTGPAIENEVFFNSYLSSPGAFSYAKSSLGWTGWYPGYGYDNYIYSSFGAFLTSTNVGIREKTDNFVLGNAFPNPTIGAISISFKMKSNDNVNISVYNLLGAKVAEVANGTFAAGEHSVNANLANLKAGVYLYTMTTGAASQTQKLIIAE